MLGAQYGPLNESGHPGWWSLLTTDFLCSLPIRRSKEGKQEHLASKHGGLPELPRLNSANLLLLPYHTAWLAQHESPQQPPASGGRAQAVPGHPHHQSKALIVTTPFAA